MNAVRPETLKYQTARLVKEFIQLKGKPLHGDAMEDAVYQFFGGRFYNDNTYEYKMLSVWMLAALAKPTIHKALKKELNGMYDDLIKLFERLHDFAETMESDRHKAGNDLHQLEHYLTGEEPYLKSKFYAYAAKTAGLRAEKEVREQQEHYLKNIRDEN